MSSNGKRESSPGSRPSTQLLFDDDGQHYWLSDPWRAWAHAFTGHWVDPCEYPHSLMGLDGYLRANGVTDFSAVELTTPRYPLRFQECTPEAPVDPISGMPVALMSRAFWPRQLCPMLIIQDCRTAAEEPIDIAHGYRPTRYNTACKSTGADHPEGCAVDFDVRSLRAWRACMVRLQELYMAGLWLSIGFCSDGHRPDGGRRFHVGVYGPRTVAKRAGPCESQRDWDYCKRTTLRGWRR